MTREELDQKLRMAACCPGGCGILADHGESGECAAYVWHQESAAALAVIVEWLEAEELSKPSKWDPDPKDGPPHKHDALREIRRLITMLKEPAP